ncbi:MAG TPA: twin-arginine translocase subunit TatC [Flavobacterium sp.]|nr:twin-arginine translocase subunit TatC [Flavobacterium sp.]
MAKVKKNPDEMSFMDHLEDLRWLLVRSTIAVLIAAVALFFVSDFIFDDIIFGPTKADFITYQVMCEVSKFFGEGADMCIREIPFYVQNTEMEGQISILIWSCITGGFIVGFPYILWELWRFIRPALYEKERKNAQLFISMASVLFFIGVLFGYYLIIPMSVHFFATFTVSAVIQNEFNLSSYMGMMKTSVLACGLLFELPIIIFFLSKLGLVTPTFLRTYRRHALVIILIAAAIVTPPDVISQIIVTIPLMVIYEISIFISAAVTKNLIKNE